MYMTSDKTVRDFFPFLQDFKTQENLNRNQLYGLILLFSAILCHGLLDALF